MRDSAVFLLCLLVAACRGPVASPRPVTDAPRAMTLPDSLSGPWRFTSPGSPRAQVLRTTAELVSTIDTLVRRDSLESRTEVFWAANLAGEPLRVTGNVRGFAVRVSGDSAWREMVTAAAPLSFVAEQAPGTALPELLTPQPAACDLDAAAVQGWRETWVAPPREVRRGSTWSDSSETSWCRDGIVLRAVMLRTFLVDRAVVRDGRLRVVVQRRSAIALRGAGLQFGDSVAIEGAGEGEATLELLPGNASIALGEGRSELRLTLRGRRRTQTLVQHGALVISQP